MLLQGCKMGRLSSFSARVLFSVTAAKVLFFALLTGAMLGVVCASRLGEIAERFPIPVSCAGRPLLRTAIVSFLFPLTAYLFSLCFGVIPSALLFFCKGMLLSCLLYISVLQNSATQTILLLLHSLLPLPLQFYAVCAQFSDKEQPKTSASPLLALLISSILTFLSEFCLKRLGI